MRTQTGGQSFALLSSAEIIHFKHVKVFAALCRATNDHKIPLELILRLQINASE